MNQCKNCRYFERNLKNKECFCFESEKVSEKYGNCFNDNFIYGNPIYIKIEENDKLYYWDWEQYNAHFKVGENFGCIHFKEKNFKPNKLDIKYIKKRLIELFDFFDKKVKIKIEEKEIYNLYISYNNIEIKYEIDKNNINSIGNVVNRIYIDFYKKIM